MNTSEVLAVKRVGGQHLIGCVKIRHIGAAEQIVIAGFKQREFERGWAAQKSEDKTVMFPASESWLPGPGRNVADTGNPLALTTGRVLPMMPGALQPFTDDL